MLSVHLETQDPSPQSPQNPGFLFGFNKAASPFAPTLKNLSRGRGAAHAVSLGMGRWKVRRVLSALKPSLSLECAKVGVGLTLPSLRIQ